MKRVMLFVISAILALSLFGTVDALTCLYGDPPVEYPSIQMRPIIFNEAELSAGGGNYYTSGGEVLFHYEQRIVDSTGDNVVWMNPWLHPDGQNAPTILDSVSIIRHYPYEACGPVDSPELLRRKMILYINGGAIGESTLPPLDMLMHNTSWYSVQGSPVFDLSTTSYLKIPDTGDGSNIIDVTSSPNSGLTGEVSVSLSEFIRDSTTLNKIIDGIDNGGGFEVEIIDTYNICDSITYVCEEKDFSEKYALPRFTNCWHESGKGENKIVATLNYTPPCDAGDTLPECDAFEREKMMIFNRGSPLSSMFSQLDPFKKDLNKFSFYTDFGKTRKACGTTPALEWRQYNDVAAKDIYTKINSRTIEYHGPKSMYDETRGHDTYLIEHAIGHVFGAGDEYVDEEYDDGDEQLLSRANCENNSSDAFVYKGVSYGLKSQGCATSGLARSSCSSLMNSMPGKYFFEDSFYNTVTCGVIRSNYLGGSPESHWFDCAPPDMRTIRETPCGDFTNYAGESAKVKGNIEQKNNATSLFLLPQQASEKATHASFDGSTPRFACTLPGAADTSSGATVTLEWDPSPDNWVAGYMVQQGLLSGVYSARYDAGLATSLTITDLKPGTTSYFTAIAYTSDRIESLPSNEVSYTVPIIPVQPPEPLGVIKNEGVYMDPKTKQEMLRWSFWKGPTDSLYLIGSTNVINLTYLTNWYLVPSKLITTTNTGQFTKEVRGVRCLADKSLNEYMFATTNLPSMGQVPSPPR